MKVFTHIPLLFILLGSTIFSQEEIPVDTLLINQEKMLENQKQILKEVTYVDPLVGKKYGVEFNPVYFLVSTTQDKGFVLTGSFSLFSFKKNAEIAFPIYYAEGDNDLKVFHLDSHYRNFLGKHRNGFYISVGLRFTSLRGREGESFFGFTWDESNEITSASKIGLTFGIGYRKFGNNGWYWGTSLFGGRYFTEESTDFLGAGMANSKSIIDMEILKIGKAF